MTNPHGISHLEDGGWTLSRILPSTHFRDDPIPKLVREVLQNSLDADDRDLVGPVAVEIAESYIDGQMIGAEALKYHLESCLERAERRRKKERPIVLRKSPKSAAYRKNPMPPDY